jgi:hypothetical protein
MSDLAKPDCTFDNNLQRLQDEEAARRANSPELWNKLWENPKQAEWRSVSLSKVYERILELMPARFAKRVFDLGGGVGTLAKKIMDERHEAGVVVIEHNEAAARGCREKSIPCLCVDLESLGCSIQEQVESHTDADDPHFSQIEQLLADQNLPIHLEHDEDSDEPSFTFCSTELFEHLSLSARRGLLWWISQAPHGFIAVPNDRMSHETEKQHATSYTALEFLEFLREYRPDARVEVIEDPARPGTYLLGSWGFNKTFSLSVCFPARDEAEDIERTLASFRGVADRNGTSRIPAPWMRLVPLLKSTQKWSSIWRTQRVLQERRWTRKTACTLLTSGTSAWRNVRVTGYS